MICTLSTGETVKLNDKEVKAAKKMVNKFLDSVKKSSAANQRATLYITTLIVMESLAGDLLSSLNPDRLKVILDAFADTGNVNKKAGNE